MADVQLENGYVKLANRLLEAMIEADFADHQLRVLLVLLRLTYGWRRKTVRLTELDLARRCHAAGSDVIRAGGAFRRAVRALLDERVLVRTPAGERGVFVWAINKDFERWGLYSSASARLESRWGERPANEAHDDAGVGGNWPAARPDSGLQSGHLVACSQATFAPELVVPEPVTALERQLNTEKDSITTTARELACAANQGLADHPTRPQPDAPIPATNGTSHTAAVAITQAGVPLAFAKSQVYEIARSHNASGAVRSLGYFTTAVIQRWREEEAASDAARTPRPAPAASRRGEESGTDPEVWRRAAAEVEARDRAKAVSHA